MRSYIDFDLTNYNSYKIYARCSKAFFPEDDNDIKLLFSLQQPRRVLLGSGHNVILSKDNYQEEFVVFSGNYDAIELVGEDQIMCEAGANMKQLTAFALANELSGVEVFYDIPSSVGGAVVMNAGAGGEDMNGIIVSVWYYNPITNEVEVIHRDQIGFEYRNSFFQKKPNMIVCKALLQLRRHNPIEIEQKMLDIEKARHAKQPRDFPNAGSVFKRPTGHFVGALIDQLNLKGYSCGGAKISEKHGGFIVNFNNASGKDVLDIIQHVQDEVRNSFGVDLEVEQRVI